MHRRRDVAEVFGEEGQSTQGLAQLEEQVVARAIDPAAIHGSWIGGGNLPELIEATEVIEAYVVAMLRGPAQALYPPLIAALLHDIPAIQRISPSLSGLAEKIGRNSSDHFGLQLAIQAKELGMSPDIGAVVVHKDGNIAHDADGALRTISTQCVPLLIECKLQGAAHSQVIREFFRCFFQC